MEDMAKDVYIENQVLLSEDGTAFLAGGSHRVMDYIRGDITPTATSVTNFWTNVRARATFSRMAGAGYAHVIFPDKQTILSDIFPIQPFICLGDIYTEAAPAEELEKVIYPVEKLKAHDNVFYPLDTHMTDEGSLIVLREMLARVGVNVDATLVRLAGQIDVRQTNTGDLGSKLSPPRFQEVRRLRKTWPYRGYHGFQTRNDGMVDILLNPEAPVQATALLFGDSFFRMMLPLLNAVFSRLICMRTRFYHQDVVRMVAPNYVFSGNVERYLSNVTSDREAHPFFLYPYLQGTPQPAEDPEFVAAYRAMLSPRTEESRRFFASVSYNRP